MREALQEQLRYSKELGEKQKDSSESESEPSDDDPETLLASAANAAESMADEMQTVENPWMQSTLKRLRKSRIESGAITESEFAAISEPPANEPSANGPSAKEPPANGSPSVGSNKNKEQVTAASNQIMTRSKRKLQENVEKKRSERKSMNDKKANISSTEDIDAIFAKVDDPKNSAGKAKIIRPDVEEIVIESSEKVKKILPKRLQKNSPKVRPEPVKGHPGPVKGHPRPMKGRPEPVKVRPEPMLDPEKFLRAPAKPLFSATSEIIEVMDEEIEKNLDADSQANLIAEAFADDDVVAEFSAEKSAIAERDRPKPVDLTLPDGAIGRALGSMKRKERKKNFSSPRRNRRKKIAKTDFCLG